VAAGVELEVARALGRAAVYRLLGAALGYPTAGRLEDISRLAETSASGTASPGLASLLVALAASAREADAATLAEEYVFLFDRQARCPPYEGAWGDAPQPAGKPALLADVAGFYTAFGLEPSASQADLEDHVASELEFMSALATKEAWALAEANPEWLEVTRGAEARFLADHLGRWAEAFAGALRSATPVPYYAAVADVLGAWLRLDTERLGASPPRVSGRSGHDPLHEDAFSCPMATPEEGPPAAGR
jgi:DMSO reductase family type II enzyme chaperone